MRLKLFIAISLVLCFSGNVAACVSEFTPESCYMFSVYNRNSLLSDSVKTRHINFWRNYTNGKVGTGQIERALYGSTNSKASGITLKSYLQKAKDADGLFYLSLLNQINKINGTQDPWNYPSKEDLARAQQTWSKILTSASQRISTSKRLGERYWLMAVRAAFYTKNKTLCQKLYGQYAKRFGKGYIADLAEGYMAYYWFNGGEKEKAREFYARTGDLRSLRWCFSRDINLESIKKLYAEAPNSVAFPYLIQDYMNSMDNNTLLNTDRYYEDKAKVAAEQTAYAKELNDFSAFAEHVIAQNKTKCPILWKSAAGYADYLNGNNVQAEKKLEEATKLSGTTAMVDNLRALRFLVRAAKGNYTNDFETYALQEIKWLMQQMATEPTYTDWYEFRNHYADVLYRVVYGQIVPKYLQENKFSTAAALVGMTDEYVHHTLNKEKHGWEMSSKVSDAQNHQISALMNPAEKQKSETRTEDENYFNGDYSSRIFELLDSADVADVVAYKELLDNPEEGTDLEKYAIGYCQKNQDFYNELIGTKYLRMEQFSKAQSWLSKVNISYIAGMNIAPYLQRNPNQPLWFDFLKRGQLKAARYVTATITTNPKLTFAVEMSQLAKQKAETTNATALAEICYQMAVRYAQASRIGDCWAYLSYAWSVDTASTYFFRPTHYTDVATNLLEQSIKSDQSDMNRTRCLFAMAALSPKPWKCQEYDKDWNLVDVLYKNELQGRCFASLSNLKDKSAFNTYGLNRCDNLKMYLSSNP
jgi:hypothetical protein